MCYCLLGSIENVLISISVYLFACFQVRKSPRGNDLMNKISDQISVGAKAFLTTEYKYLSVFMCIVAIILFILYFLNAPSGHWGDGLRYSLCFLAGGFLSASAGWRGMATATVRVSASFVLLHVVLFTAGVLKYFCLRWMFSGCQCSDGGSGR